MERERQVTHGRKLAKSGRIFFVRNCSSPKHILTTVLPSLQQITLYTEPGVNARREHLP